MSETKTKELTDYERYKAARKAKDLYFAATIIRAWLGHCSVEQIFNFLESEESVPKKGTLSYSFVNVLERMKAEHDEIKGTKERYSLGARSKRSYNS